VSDIDTAAVDSLKALDPNRPIREADMCGATRDVRYGPIADIYMAELLVIRATRLFSIHLLILRDLLAA
jgi:hypothetical protein